MRAERFSNEAVNEMMQLIKTVKKRNKEPQILYTVNSGYSSWAKKLRNGKIQRRISWQNLLNASLNNLKFRIICEKLTILIIG